MQRPQGLDPAGESSLRQLRPVEEGGKQSPRSVWSSVWTWLCRLAILGKFIYFLGPSSLISKVRGRVKIFTLFLGCKTFSFTPTGLYSPWRHTQRFRRQRLNEEVSNRAAITSLLGKADSGLSLPLSSERGLLGGDLLCPTPKGLIREVSGFVFLLESINLQRKWASGHISGLGP